MTENNNNIDRRIVKTKKALQRAIWKLVKEQDISSITITKLCQEADINRKTFYMYYNTPYDVFNEGIDSFVRKLNERTSLIVSEGLPINISSIQIFLEPLIKSEDNFREIILSPNSRFLNEKLVETFSKSLLNQINADSSFCNLNSSLKTLLATLQAECMVSIYFSHAKNPEEITIEDVSELLLKLFTKGIDALK